MEAVDGLRALRGVVSCEASIDATNGLGMAARIFAISASWACLKGDTGSGEEVIVLKAFVGRGGSVFVEGDGVAKKMLNTDEDSGVEETDLHLATDCSKEVEAEGVENELEASEAFEFKE